MGAYLNIANKVIDSANSRPAKSLTLAEFATNKRVLRVWSDVLGQEIVFAADNASIPSTNCQPVYLASELFAVWRQRSEVTADSLRLIHRVKLKFVGSMCVE